MLEKIFFSLWRLCSDTKTIGFTPLQRETLHIRIRSIRQKPVGVMVCSEFFCFWWFEICLETWVKINIRYYVNVFFYLVVSHICKLLHLDSRWSPFTHGQYDAVEVQVSPAFFYLSSTLDNHQALTLIRWTVR